MGIESSKDPQGFQNFEQQGWRTVSQGYDQHFSRLTGQSTTAVLDAANISGNKKLLDVCCGPGMLAAAAIKRGAQAIGIDFSAEVVEIAKSNFPDAEFLEGDAQSLPFADDSFDAVVCGFGIIHVPDPLSALSEMRRVVKSGGRVAVSVWELPNADNGFGLLYGAIKAHADMNVDLPHGPDFFQFSDPARLRESLLEVGFSEPAVVTVNQTWEFTDANGMMTGIMEGAVRARALLAAQTTSVQRAISDAVNSGMADFLSPDGVYRLPMPALVGSATK